MEFPEYFSLLANIGHWPFPPPIHSLTHPPPMSLELGFQQNYHSHHNHHHHHHLYGRLRVRNPSRTDLGEESLGSNQYARHLKVFLGGSLLVNVA